jgi:hypothetical protein
VLRADSRAAVYWFPLLGEALPGEKRVEEGSVVFACARGHRPTVVHDVTEFADNVPPCDNGCLRNNWRRTITLAGPILAYATDTQEDTKYRACDCEQWGIVVRNLETGVLLHRARTGPHRGTVDEEELPGGPPTHGDLWVGVGPAESIVAKTDGSVAWIAENRVAWIDALRAGKHEKPSYELRAIDADGERLLASGPDLAPRSLSLHAGKLEWRNGGVRSSAPLV